MIAFPFLLIFNISAFPFRAIHKRFPKFFLRLWKVVSFPFRLIFSIIAFPFRMVGRFYKFLNTEPEERPLADVFVDLVENQDTRQMMWDQVEALRMHIIRAVLALLAAIIFSFSISRDLSVFLVQPLDQKNLLETIEVTEGFSVFMNISMAAGITISIPYIFFEIWLFAAPGLRSREKKLGIIGIPLATFLFICGVAFTYYILPPAFLALRQFNEYMGFATSWRPDSYYRFITNLMFWMGIFFEYPLVIYILTAIGLIQPKVLVQQWRLAIVVITIIAAVITPTVDPINQGLVMAPMIVLYFIGIGLSYIAYAGRKRNQAEAEKNID